MSWQELAVKWADKIGVPRDVMLATVEAETGGRNVLGDARGPNGEKMAMGYGQVWASKWYYDKLQLAAKDVGLDASLLPAQGDISGLQTVITSNDELSMALAARTIKSVWEGAGGDFVAFVKSYVGPKVPETEINRRITYRAKYQQEGIVMSPPATNFQLDLPFSLGNELIAWTLIGIGALIMLKKLGGDLAAARGKALEVSEHA